MADELKTLVYDDLDEIDCVGDITMFKTMINHMVLCNQESIDALYNWLCIFDICQYDGQNISIATGQIRAVIWVLNGFGLPTNLIRCLLGGFAHPASAPFNALCTTLVTMERASTVQQDQGLILKHKYFSILKDLEICFTDLSVVHKWEGVGHTASTYSAQMDEDSLLAMAA